MASVEVSILRISISSISPDLSSSYASKMILNLSSGVPLGVHRASRADPRHFFVAYAAADLYIQRMHRDCARILLSEFYICPIYVLTCRINIHIARKRRLLIYPTIPEGRGRAAIARWALASL